MFECMSATVGDLVAEGVSADRLGALYEAHAADALRLAYLLTGDRMVAQDLVQDAFVKMAGRLAHLRRADAFGAYLRVTVVNMARMRGRRLKVERDYLARTLRRARRAAPRPGRRLHREPAPRARHAAVQAARRDRAAVLRGRARRRHRPGARVPSGHRPLAHPPRPRDAARRARRVGPVTDELREELDRLAAEAPAAGERREQVLHAARRRSHVGLALASGAVVAGVLVGVLALGAVLDRRATARRPRTHRHGGHQVAERDTRAGSDRPARSRSFATGSSWLRSEPTVRTRRRSAARSGSQSRRGVLVARRNVRHGPAFHATG